jgi:5'-nucleotidase
MPLKVISFDLEGTLIDHSFSTRIWENEIPRLYSIQKNLPLVQAKQEVKNQYKEVGEGNPEWYDITYWWNRLNLPGDYRSTLNENLDSCHLYPDTDRTLKRLSSKYSIIICSNTIRVFLETQLQCINVSFHRIISAPSDYHTLKSNPAFYHRICRDLDIRPFELAHIGDHVEFDYRTAVAAGVQAYHLDRSGKLAGPDVVHTLIEFEERLRV